jgi:quercetin dioxygenase-like cupin family protein
MTSADAVIKVASGHVATDSEGEALWYGGTLVLLRATHEQTGGQFAMLEIIGGRGNGTPLHVHEREDELIRVLDGEIEVVTGDARGAGGPGFVALSPRGVAHAFRVTSDEARLLFVFTPGNDSEGFFRDAGDPAAARTLPPPSEPDIERAMRAGEAHFLKIVGPPPFDD